MPTAIPASSSGPRTISASATTTPSVSGTSVTAMCPYATFVVSTATIAAATAPASALPYARCASHQVAATAPTASTTTPIRAARYDGSSWPSCVGASA